MAIAAPVIEAEMRDWVALGGGNSGIVGNGLHVYGFHRSAREVPASDYSRRRDPNGSDGPYVNWDYACAGDFHHGGDERLRAMHRTALARLMAGDPALSMICEFIGQPWADRPVMYWARWEGITNLRKYTGSGHDKWSHFSWYRSRANQRPHLWTAQGGASVYCAKGATNDQNTKSLQVRLKNVGTYTGAIDGDYGSGTAAALAKACKLMNPKTGADGSAFDHNAQWYLARLEQRQAYAEDAKPLLDRMGKLEAALKALPAPATPAPGTGGMTLPATLRLTGGVLEVAAE